MNNWYAGFHPDEGEEPLILQSPGGSYPSDSEDELTERTALISEEKAMSGNVKLSVIFAYCRACTWFVTVITVILNILAQAASITTNFWLSKWSNAQICQSAPVINESIGLQQVASCNGSNV